MNHLIFCVHDAKASAHLPPFFLPTAGMAVRAISDCVNDPSHAFGQHPEDYTLFQLGSFDDQTGMITSDTKFSLGNCIEFRLAQDLSQLDLPVGPGVLDTASNGGGADHA